MKHLALIWLGLLLIGIWKAWTEKLLRDYPLWAVALVLILDTAPFAVGIYAIALGMARVIQGGA